MNKITNETYGGAKMNYKLNKNTLSIAMLNKGYSINKLSKRSGVGKATISRIFRDTTNARPETLYKIAKALDLEAEDLLLKE